MEEQKVIKVPLAKLLEKNKIEFGSPAHKALVEGAYGLTVEDAKIIIEEWKKDHKSWPLAEVRKAQAMLETLNAKPVAISTKPGWKREKSSSYLKDHAV